MRKDRALCPGTLLQGGKYQIVEALWSDNETFAYLAENNITSKRVVVRELYTYVHVRREDLSLCTEMQLPPYCESYHSIGDTYSDACRAAFIRRARLFSEFSHPNIESIIDVFEENCTAYCVSEEHDGELLYDVVARSGALGQSEVLEIMAQLCSAVSYMHKRRVPYESIHTKHILRHHNSNKIELLFAVDCNQCLDDLGIPHSITIYTPPVGKPLSCDIFMLGAVLHEITTGKPAPNVWDIAEHGIEKCLSLPEGPIRRAIVASMRLRSTERVQSVEEFAEILGVAIDGRVPQVITQPAARGDRDIHGREIAPNNYMVLSFFALLLCVPLGLVAIMKASQVDGYWNRGQKDLARATSRVARNWAIVGLIVGVVLVIGYIAYLVSQMTVSYHYTYYEYPPM